ncbi:MAG: sodium:proton antiporter [Ktedonobacteraceae bacterium]|nr:sodium:proton antiporter [Ktedonobacteraceae bacterium]
MTDIAAVVRLLVVLLLIAMTVILLTRRLELPYTLGLVTVGLIISLVGHPPEFHLTPELVLFVFLPALLFEGAWSISLNHLLKNWRVILLLAVPGLLLEVVLIAVPLHLLTVLPWSDAFLLAAILSPTDPVAVLGLFRQLKIDVRLSTIIEGESLFNDGVAGVLYKVCLVFVLLPLNGQEFSLGEILWQSAETLVLEAGGGILLGLACGFLVSRFVRFIDDGLLETTLTIVTAYGLYLLADFLHTSGILAVIIGGLVLGSYGRERGMSERTREAVDNFWSMVAFLANALLFLLVGAQLDPSEFLTPGRAGSLLWIAGLVIVLVLLARFVIVLLLPRHISPFDGLRLRSWRFVIFWSGLRGALSMALVLALPVSMPDREELIFSTYAVVLFTLLVQGFSLRWILKRLPLSLRSEKPVPETNVVDQER